MFFALQESLSDYGSLYLIILGSAAIAITLLAPGGLWSLITRYRPMALFGIQRRLVFDGGAPRVPPPASPPSPAGPGGHD